MWGEEMQNEEYNGASQNDNHIDDVIAYIEAGKYSEAVHFIDKELCVDNNNYELYYLRALCHEQLGEFEKAYYEYRMAIFFGRGSIDEELMNNRINEFCSYANVNSYTLGVEAQKLIEERIRFGEYEKTQQFLGVLLYDKNRTAANIVLTEENMLLYMMLEIVLCEKKRFNEGQFKADNTIVRYGCDINAFNDVYRQVKLMVRRIWFGASVNQQKEINDVIAHNKISADMLAVIVKYSVREEYWVDAFSRLAAILQYRFPEIAGIILEYRNYVAGIKLPENEKCMEPYDFDNGAECLRLDCKTGEITGCDELPDNAIAIIFCTNDELYAAECVRYIRRLTIPEGMNVVVVELVNAAGMAAGYNAAMEKVKAEYKVYIHHDTFIIDRNVLLKLVKAFKGDESIGMIGVAGTAKLGNEAKWWESEDKSELRMNLYQDAVLDILKSVSFQKTGEIEQVEVLDGIFMATRYDVKWREDLFDGWHFYDISQCFEFNKRGYKVCALNDEKCTLMHETTMKKDKFNLYYKYRDKFIAEYMK